MRAAPASTGIPPEVSLSVPTAASEDPRRGLHDVVVSLARHPDIVAFARALVRGRAAQDRLGRIAAAFTFVGHLVDVPPPVEGECRDGVDVLVALVGEDEGPAVILAALLQALGERAGVRSAPGMAFVSVELRPEDVALLPPHATLLTSGQRCLLPLDARSARRPMGFLPLDVRRRLARPPGLRLVPGSAPRGH